MTPRALVERQYALVAARDWDAMRALFDPEVETVAPGAPPLRGYDAFVAYNRGFHEQFPDGRLALVRVAAEGGDAIAVEGLFTGTHAATGRAVSVPFLDEWRVRDGRLAYHRVWFDRLDLAEQLGAASP